MSEDSPNLPAAPTHPPIIEGSYDLLDIKGLDNPDSIVNLVPTWLSEAISVIPDEAIDMTYESLRKQAKPTSVEEKLRHSFWNEYKRIIHNPRKPKLSVNNVIGGVCSLNSFKKISCSTFKLAYILQPPPSVDLAFDELIHKGLAEMMEIMKEPLVNQAGNFNHKLAALKSKILNDVITRRNGNVAQNINFKAQSHVLNQHEVTHYTPPQPSDIAQVIDVIRPETAYQITTADIEAALANEEHHEPEV